MVYQENPSPTNDVFFKKCLRISLQWNSLLSDAKLDYVWVSNCIEHFQKEPQTSVAQSCGLCFIGVNGSVVTAREIQK